MLAEAGLDDHSAPRPRSSCIESSLVGRGTPLVQGRIPQLLRKERLRWVLGRVMWIEVDIRVLAILEA